MARYMAGILSHYFPVVEGWLVTPQLESSNRQIPDLTVERVNGSAIQPHIYVELKSVIGRSLRSAIDQIADATADNFEEGEGFLFVAKGSKIGFLERYRYISQQEPHSYRQIMPFNQEIPGFHEHPDRPTYVGGSRPTFPETGRSYVLDVRKDREKVHEVFTWMKWNDARDVYHLLGVGND